jgi:restriction endonuclease S subunit
MKTHLEQVVAVRAGVAFREAIKHEEGGGIAIVQAGDVQAGYGLDIEGLVRIKEAPGRGELQAIAEGEVLLQCRGQSYRAAVVPALDLPVVPTASLLVLKPSPQLLPEYLAQFLNDPVTQAELRTLATGATIANLKRSSLEQLQVLVPSLEDQKHIVAYGETLREISRLEARLAELRHIELRALLERCSERNRKRVNAPGS